MKTKITSLNQLPEKQREQAKLYYEHIARAVMLCQSAIHSIDEVNTNMFHRHELRRCANAFINGVELYANTFVETGNVKMVQSYSNIVKSIDEFKQNIKVTITEAPNDSERESKRID